jgi:hypothetical protein
MKYLLWSVLLLVGCHKPITLPEDDWMFWAQKVEARSPVTDATGHGPDIGSNEWALTLQHKLQLFDGLGTRPAVGSTEWRMAVEKKLPTPD